MGPHYLDSNWKQQLMTFSEFVDKYVAPPSGQHQATGYLAQIELFEFIPGMGQTTAVKISLSHCCREVMRILSISPMVSIVV